MRKSELMTTTTPISLRRIEDDHSSSDHNDNIKNHENQQQQQELKRLELTVQDNSSERYNDEDTSTTPTTCTASTTVTKSKSRKILISLRSRKIVQSNKKIINANTTQRKLYSLNNLRKNNNRYKYVRSDPGNPAVNSELSYTPNSSAPEMRVATAVAGKLQQGEVVRRTSKRTIIIPKRTTSSASRTRAVAFRAKRKFDPSKFKYVKPNE